MTTTAATTTDPAAGGAPPLAALADRLELEALVSRLGRWLDAGGEPAAAPSLFTPDVAVRTPGGRAEGIDAVVAQGVRNHAVPTQHLITNPLIALAGDRATISANLLAAFAREDGPELIGERYALEAVRTARGWRLSRVEVTPVWRR